MFSNICKEVVKFMNIYVLFSSWSLFLVAHVRSLYRRKHSLLLLLDSNRNLLLKKCFFFWLKNLRNLLLWDSNFLLASVVSVFKKLFLNGCVFDAAFFNSLSTHCFEVFLISVFSGKNGSMLFLSFSFNNKKSSSQLNWLIFVSTSTKFSYEDSFTSFRKISIQVFAYLWCCV